jgi:hypothetical protein
MKYQLRFSRLPEPHRRIVQGRDKSVALGAMQQYAQTAFSVAGGSEGATEKTNGCK